MADDLVTRIPDDFPDADLVRARLKLVVAGKALRYIPESDPEHETFGDEWIRCERILIDVQARTPYGVHAKLDTVRDILQIGVGGNEEEILQSAIRDLQGLELEWNAFHWDKAKNRRRPVY